MKKETAIAEAYARILQEESPEDPDCSQHDIMKTMSYIKSEGKHMIFSIKAKITGLNKQTCIKLSHV
jgi:hypothetical protein